MKHIRYMTSNKTVCEKPDNLGTDFVTTDYAPADVSSCGICLSLLTAHNKREYEKEGLVNVLQDHNSVQEDPHKSFQGLMVGLAVATVFWLSVALFLWMVIV